MEVLIREIKLGAKLLYKDYGFAVTAILTLAICIGANAAIFTIVNSVLLRPLPIPEPDRVVFISNQYPGAGVPETYSVGIPDYIDRKREMTALFEDEAMFRPEDQTVEINETPERMKGMRITASLFHLLRTPVALGRPFTEDEAQQGNEQKVILSYSLWQQLYAGSSAAVGQSLRVNGRPYSIVGVMPRNFLFFDPKVQFWLPYAFTDNEKAENSRHSNVACDIARLNPGASIEQAQSRVDALAVANLDKDPKSKPFVVNAGFHTKVRLLDQILTRDIKSTLYLLWGGAILVLLIGGVNIANLVLARSSLRRKELTTRLALGGSRMQVGRLLIAEGVLLALIGGAAGLVISGAAMPALSAIGLSEIPRASEIRLDLTVVVFVMAVSILVGLLIGLVPWLQLSRIDLSTALREESRSGTGGRTSRMIRRGLVTAQVGLASILLIGAGLLLASFSRLLAVDPGFRTDVVTISTAAAASSYPKDADARTLLNRTLQAFRSISGVTAAGATNTIPFGGNVNKSIIAAEGYTLRPGESLLAPMSVSVTPGYFEAMGTTLMRGRYFNEHDNDTAPPVALVDERLAHKFWPGQDAVGKRLYEPDDTGDLKITEKTKYWTVIGVVRDVQLADLTGEEQPLGAYYFALDQSPDHRFTIAVKTPMSQAALTQALRAEMRKIDPDIPLFDIKTMGERMQLSLLSRRAAMVLGLTFAAVALFLAAIGIYGVLTYLVAQRTREIGIRIALGSNSRNVFQLVLREGMILVGAGLALGLAGAVALRRVIEGEVFGVHPLDPWVLSSVIAGLALIALAACALPARRATRVDPVRVLGA